MCLAEFSASYATGGSDNVDEEPEDGDDDDDTTETIQLQNGMGKMHKRRKEAIIRFHRPSLEKEPENFYRAMLMLYLPWRDEETDLKGNHESFQEHWQAERELILRNGGKYTINAKEIEQAFEDLENNGPPEHAWANLAPGAEQERLEQIDEGEQVSLFWYFVLLYIKIK